jgi:hypothetical protein
MYLIKLHILLLLAPISYNYLFVAFLLLQFGFLIFWQKVIGEKAARKMLVKLTTV